MAIGVNIFTPEELKNRLDGEKYTKFYDFRRFIIDKSIEEINKYSDEINVSYDTYYKGKIAQKVYFIITDAGAKQAYKAMKAKKEKFQKK